MSYFIIIDRRKNPSGKNLPNRQRFLKRVRKHLSKQIKDAMKNRNIDQDGGEEIIVPKDDINEPGFDYDHNSGNWDRILPGNRDYLVGDKIEKTKSQPGTGGNEGSENSGPDDEFRFTISRDEYLDLVFDDLELPDMIKKSEKAAVITQRARAGFQINGTPSSIDLIRSLKNSIGRRVALHRPTKEQVDMQRLLVESLEKTADTDEQKEELNIAQLELEAMLKKQRGVGWIDPMDIRYKRWELRPVPNSRAVMFCLMDVSGSMGEKEKETSKRFFLLLYLFLIRQYTQVDIVFVRHTETAKECDEKEFFNSTESGGTVISTGLTLINDIITKRYPLDSWNIYGAQTTDGDNVSADNSRVSELLDILLKKVQYYVYLEIHSISEYQGEQGEMYSSTANEIWKIIEDFSTVYDNLCFDKLDGIDAVVPAFRKIFSKEKKKRK